MASACANVGYIVCISNSSSPGRLRTGWTNSFVENLLLYPGEDVKIAKKVKNPEIKYNNLVKLLMEYHDCDGNFVSIPVERLMMFFCLFDGEMWESEKSIAVAPPVAPVAPPVVAPVAPPVVAPGVKKAPPEIVSRKRTEIENERKCEFLLLWGKRKGGACGGKTIAGEGEKYCLRHATSKTVADMEGFTEKRKRTKTAFV
jgi:hypothetical protein